MELLNGGDVTASPVAYTTADWNNDRFDYTNTPHAVTTPDETALTLKPLLFGPSRTELPNVPEEDESASGRKDPPDPTSELEKAKSFASLKSCSIRWSSSSSRESGASPASPLSEDFPSSELAVPLVGQSFDDDVPIRPRLSCRLSIALNDIDHCWEDDIDYCYEHAAEADCDFDWDRLSMEDGKSSITGALDGSNFEPAREGGRYSKMFLDDTRPRSSVQLPNSISLFDLRSLEMSVPDLDPSSRHSTKSSTVSIGCPVTPSYSASSTPCNALPLDPSKTERLGPASGASSNHVSLEPRLVAGVVCQKLLAVGRTPGSHGFDSFENSNLRFDAQGDNNPGAMVKSNSQESFFYKKTNASSGCYRGSIATTSLPNLFTSMDQLQQKDEASGGAADLPALSATEIIPTVQPRPILRPRRSPILRRGTCRQADLHELTDLSLVSSSNEKPLPLPPLSSQPDKPLPSPPFSASFNEISLFGMERQLHSSTILPPPDLQASDRFASSDRHHLLANGSIIEPAPFGFFPSIPLPLTS